MQRPSTFKQRTLAVTVLLALLWGVEAVDGLLGGSLNRYGVRPRELAGLWGIPLAPFLHGGWGHLAANSAPLFVLGWLVALRGLRNFIEVSVVIILLGGFGTWLIGKPHSVHIGASGLIFGYFGFLILRGLIDLNLTSILSSLIVGLFYGGLIWGVLPSHPGVSWESLRLEAWSFVELFSGGARHPASRLLRFGLCLHR